MIDHDARVEAAGRELAALIDAVAAGDLTSPVPTCPGWTVGDLALHVGQFCDRWLQRTRDATDRAPVPFTKPAPDDPGLVDWLREWGDLLMADLRALPPETEVWTWYDPDQTAGFVARRSVHELAVHRYDAQSARGTCTPIGPPAVAIDGIEEMVGTLTTRVRSGEDGGGRTLHVHGTDDGVEGAEWLLTLHRDRVDVARVHAKGDLALRGSVSDLELLLYGRPTLDTVERFGDEAVLDSWYRTFTF